MLEVRFMFFAILGSNVFSTFLPRDKSSNLTIRASAFAESWDQPVFAREESNETWIFRCKRSAFSSIKPATIQHLCWSPIQ